MSNQFPQESRTMRLKDVLSSYAVYVALFVGTGFLSGSIVHFPISPTRYAIIGIIGTIIFTIASTMNEALFNKKNFKDEGIFKVILFSLLLSIGIGMISGGAQHFNEFPIYGSYLIPFGVLLSLIAFVIKSNIHLLPKQVSKLALSTLLVLAPLGLGLNTYARTLDVSSHGHSEVVSNKQLEGCSKDGCGKAGDHTMSMNVENDSDFLMGMVPHHQEAVDTSAFLLTRTSDPELQQFVKNVIDVQSTEIDQMKGWHNEWFNSEYQNDGTYMPMMGELSKLKDKELEKAYIQGMIAHHKGAIGMANQIMNKTNRPEIKTMAQAIIDTQTKEVALLEGWLNTKYSSVTVPSNTPVMMDDDTEHTEDMMHH